MVLGGGSWGWFVGTVLPRSSSERAAIALLQLLLDEGQNLLILFLQGLNFRF